MIHIFNACKEVCALPGKACTSCGSVCRGVNCGPVEECCSTTGKACTDFTEKPLCSFVIIAELLSLAELYECMNALNEPGVANCKLPQGAGSAIGIYSWLYLQALFAVLNMAFAPWFQFQVWNRILAGVSQAPVVPGTPLAGAAAFPGFAVPQHAGGMVPPGPRKVDKAIVANAFKDVFLNDLGVLFYFFALMASLVWSWMGASWTLHGSGGCDDGGYTGWAHWLGSSMFWIAFWYSIFWYCFPCCASSVTVPAPLASYGPAFRA